MDKLFEGIGRKHAFWAYNYVNNLWPYVYYVVLNYVHKSFPSRVDFILPFTYVLDLVAHF